MNDKQRRVSLTLRVDEDVHRKLKLRALRKDMTVQAYILGLIKADDIDTEKEEVKFGV